MGSAWMAKWQGRVMNEDDLVAFINDVGFCTISALDRWPEFPSQAVAMGRDDALGATWFWKDDLHIQKRIYYTRLFTGKPGFISMEYLPAFIATNGEVMDELAMYGRIPMATQDVFRVIDEQGPISTKEIKSLLGSDGRRSASTALIDLERMFIITKTNITGRERGTYAYVWDLAERWTPEAFAEADRIGRGAAVERIEARFAELSVELDRDTRGRLLSW